ncbi:hypothetical protein [Kaarinaea lacus]
MERFKIEESRDAFVEFIKQHAGDPNAILVTEAIDLTLSFYKECRVAQCKLEEDGDMLLYQWGYYNWHLGEYFEFDLTRQMTRGADSMFQLQFKWLYEPDDILKTIEPNNSGWCRTPNEAEEFKQTILQSKAYAAAKIRKPMDVRLFLTKV